MSASLLILLEEYLWKGTALAVPPVRLMHFKIIGRVAQVEAIAKGTAIRERKRLAKIYGKGRWRKLKGFAEIQFDDGTICEAEIHWYEAHGIGAKEYKIKRIIE